MNGERAGREDADLHFAREYLDHLEATTVNPVLLRAVRAARADLPAAVAARPAGADAATGTDDVLDELVAIAEDWAWEPGIQPTDEQRQILRDTLARPLRRYLDAAAAVERVRELHRPDPRVPQICSECSDEITVGWPCDTIRALGGMP